jgi:uncharacterized membrane protein
LCHVHSTNPPFFTFVNTQNNNDSALRSRWAALVTRVLARCSSWSFPVFMASVFFAFSLAPSLLPRPTVVQGLLSGVSLAVGYGFGVFGVWLWHYLQLPRASAQWQRRLGIASASVGGLIILVFLWRSTVWQNTVRELMGMEPLLGGSSFLLALIAGAVFGLLLLISRLFRRVFRIFVGFLHRFLPPRISNAVGLALTILLFWSAINGVLVRSALRVADRSFQQLDAFIEPDKEPPPSFHGSGESRSLVDWGDLGRQGRAFVASGPSTEKMTEFFGKPTPAAIRVYVGLNSASTFEERADLALRELIRAGGFERSTLLLATPTGSGWLDPGAQDTVEYILRGDIATVAAQYSYLNSPLALLTQADYGKEMAQALFAKIYGHWRTLPRDSRPRLFLHGLSLGSFNSDLSFDIFDIIDDPFDGALWSGPPYRVETWRMATARREAGTPAWLPVFRDGTVVRFANQQGFSKSGGEWGRFRILFLQYASDPITFFEPAMFWREPEWMKNPRGPDVTPDLKWFPVVTALHVAADMVVGTAPSGFGHEIAPADYIDAWIALMEPEGWSPAEVERLKAVFVKDGKP